MYPRIFRYDYISKLGLSIAGYISPQSIISKNTHIGEGVIILDMVSVHPKASLSKGTFVSSGAVLGHDFICGEFSWIGSKVVFGGSVSIGSEVFLGIGSSIANSVNIGDSAIVGAGVTITSDIPSNMAILPLASRSAVPSSIVYSLLL